MGNLCPWQLGQGRKGLLFLELHRATVCKRKRSPWTLRLTEAVLTCRHPCVLHADCAVVWTAGDMERGVWSIQTARSSVPVGKCSLKAGKNKIRFLGFTLYR